MRFAVIIAAATLLYYSRPDLFTWDATGFRTLLAFTALTVVAVVYRGKS